MSSTLEHFGEDGQATGKHRQALLRQPQAGATSTALRAQQLLDQQLDSRGSDDSIAIGARAQNIADRADRARRTDRVFPTVVLERRLHRFQLESRGKSCALHALFGEHAVAEDARAHAHAAHVQSFRASSDADLRQ